MVREKEVKKTMIKQLIKTVHYKLVRIASYRLLTSIWVGQRHNKGIQMDDPPIPTREREGAGVMGKGIAIQGMRERWRASGQATGPWKGQIDCRPELSD